MAAISGAPDRRGDIMADDKRKEPGIWDVLKGTYYRVKDGRQILDDALTVGGDEEEKKRKKLRLENWQKGLRVEGEKQGK